MPDSIGSAEEFEEGMSAIRAVTGHSAEEMDALTDKALSIGQQFDELGIYVREALADEEDNPSC